MTLYLVGMVLVVGGLGFKIAAVPFHFYAPDVYQGTTNTNAGLLAVVPKIAGIVALVRLVSTTLPPDTAIGWQLALVLAIITMTVGNVCALWQRNIRRLLAYSSIAHAGYMLIGFAVGLAAPELGGIAAMLFYLAVYALASLGTFAALTYLSSQQHEVSDMGELSGLSRAHPWIAGAIAVCMFSMAGIPPLAGFWGKLALFSGAIRLAVADAGSISTWFLLLAIVAALNAATAAAYYLRVIGAMYFRPATSTPPAEGGPGGAGGCYRLYRSGDRGGSDARSGAARCGKGGSADAAEYRIANRFTRPSTTCRSVGTIIIQGDSSYVVLTTFQVIAAWLECGQWRMRWHSCWLRVHRLSMPLMSIARLSSAMRRAGSWLGMIRKS